MLNFTTHGLLGYGTVYISQDENPAEVPEKLDTVVPFTAKTATSADMKSGSVAQPAELWATVSAQKKLVVGTAAAPAAAAPVSPLADPGTTIDQQDLYDVVVDSADWPANTTKTARQAPSRWAKSAWPPTTRAARAAWPCP